MIKRAVLMGVLDAIHQAVRIGLDLREKRQLLQQADEALLECVRSDDDVEMLLRELAAMRQKGKITDTAYREVLGHLCRFLRDRLAFNDAVLSMLDRGMGT